MDESSKEPPKEISRLSRVEEKLEELESKKKKKGLRIPWKARISKGKAKQNYVTVIKLNENRHVDFEKKQIIDQTIMVDGSPRLAAGEYIFNYKNKPILILPSWSVEPFSPSQHYQKTLKDGSNSVGYRLLMNKMQTETIKLGKKMGGLGLTIGGLIIGGVILYGLLTG